MFFRNSHLVCSITAAKFTFEVSVASKFIDFINKKEVVPKRLRNQTNMKQMKAKFFDSNYDKNQKILKQKRQVFNINTASANQCDNVNDIDGNFCNNCVVIVDSRVDV